MSLWLDLFTGYSKLLRKMHIEVEVWWYSIPCSPDTVDVYSRLTYKLISELLYSSHVNCYFHQICHFWKQHIELKCSQ